MINCSNNVQKRSKGARGVFYSASQTEKQRENYVVFKFNGLEEAGDNYLEIHSYSR